MLQRVRVRVEVEQMKKMEDLIRITFLGTYLRICELIDPTKMPSTLLLAWAK